METETCEQMEFSREFTNQEWEVFWAAMTIELSIAAERISKTADHEQQATLFDVFEELYHRIDFQECRITASVDAALNVPREALNSVTAAVLFGNFVAQRFGVLLTDLPTIN